MTDILQYYTATQVRELNRLAIEVHQIPGFELMLRAGRAAFDVLRAQWPEIAQLIIFCGTGNNGGDGFVIAALAKEQGLNVDVYVFGNSATIKGDAQKALQYARKSQVPIHFQATAPALSAAHTNTVIIDALLGTGLAGDVRAPFRQAIETINNSGLPVLAVDIPSGLCSDTGRKLGVCVMATLTVTFIGRKIGLVRGKGPEACGRVVFDALGLPSDLYRHNHGSSMLRNDAV